MNLKPFLLDQWLQARDPASIIFNLGASTGPRWTVGEVLDLEPGSRDRVFDTVSVYAPSEGSPALRTAIADLHGVEAEHVQVVTGGAEALLILFFIAAGPQVNVLAPSPGFPTYAAVPEALGMEVRPYHLRREDNYRPDFDELERLADGRTRLLIVNTPHNPTGAILSASDLRRLHDFAHARGIQLVSDEVFHPIYHGATGASAASLPHATIIGNVSKALSLGGMRVGWIVERDEKRRAAYRNAREYFTVSNNVVGELVAEIAVRHRETIWRRTREVAQANLALADQLIAAHAGVLDWIRPAGGMTGFPRLLSGADSRPLCEAAARQGVLVVPGDCFGVPDHFRLGFGVGRETFPAAMKQLAEVIRTIAG